MFDSKKLAASCAAVASLAMFGLTGTAMAVETPTTSDTSAPSDWVQSQSTWTRSASSSPSYPAVTITIL